MFGLAHHADPFCLEGPHSCRTAEISKPRNLPISLRRCASRMRFGGWICEALRAPSPMSAQG
eukprot:3923224-Pyramimonas_sp.AAC.3